MTKEEKIQFLCELFSNLKIRGVVRTREDFAKLLSTSRTTLSSATSGDPRYLTDSLIARAMAVANEYNNTTTSNNPVEIQAAPTINLVPTIPYKAYKEIGVDLNEYLHSQSPDLHMSPAVAQFAKTDCHYFVGSDAMLPHLHQSDVLALKRMPDEAQVINGEIYVVNSKYNGLIARFVYDDGDYLILKASEEQTRYTPMRLPKMEIFGLYRVLGLVRTNI